jgi:hypothetical protein
VQLEVCETRIGLDRHVTETDVMAGGTPTETVVDPYRVASWTEVAVIVAVPAVDGVKTPAEVMDPPMADQIIAGLYFPVPRTVGVQLELPVVRIVVGLQTTATEVIVGASTKMETVADTDVFARLVAVIDTGKSAVTAAGAV